MRALTKSNMLRLVGELDEREEVQNTINDSYIKGLEFASEEVQFRQRRPT